MAWWRRGGSSLFGSIICIYTGVYTHVHRREQWLSGRGVLGVVAAAAAAAVALVLAVDEAAELAALAAAELEHLVPQRRRHRHVARRLLEDERPRARDGEPLAAPRRQRHVAAEEPAERERRRAAVEDGVGRRLEAVERRRVVELRPLRELARALELADAVDDEAGRPWPSGPPQYTAASKPNAATSFSTSASTSSSERSPWSRPSSSRRAREASTETPPVSLSATATHAPLARWVSRTSATCRRVSSARHASATARAPRAAGAARAHRLQRVVDHRRRRPQRERVRGGGAARAEDLVHPRERRSSRRAARSVRAQ